jgi:hypothetical protein
MPKGHLRHPYGQVQGWQGRHQEGQKSDHLEYQTGQSDFLESGQHLYSWELIRQMILESTTVKFRRSGSSSPRLSSNALLLGRATNAWGMGAYVDDVTTLSSLGGVVWTVGSTTNALPSGVVRTF